LPKEYFLIFQEDESDKACIEERQDEHGTWQATSPDFRPLLESNPRLEPPLREVMLQLLSAAPEQRGTAAQVARARAPRQWGTPPRHPGRRRAGERSGLRASHELRTPVTPMRI